MEKVSLLEIVVSIDSVDDLKPTPRVVRSSSVSSRWESGRPS